MNREIKFRAWFVEETKLLQVRELYQSEDSGVYAVQVIREDESGAQYWYTLAPSRFILMQFTGLKDKNGKEIYEGDILCSTENSEVYRVDEIVPLHRQSHVTNLGWIERGDFHARSIGGAHNNHDDWMSWPEMYEIIGNIYQNSELLK